MKWHTRSTRMQFNPERPFVPREVTEEEMEEAVKRMMFRWHELINGYNESDATYDRPSQ